MEHEGGCRIAGIGAPPCMRQRRAMRLVWSCLRKRREYAESDGKTAFMIAVCNGHTDCIKLLLKKEAGMQDEDGRTALMGAAEHDHIECVKLLIEKEVGMQSKNGWTALMLATYNNKLECAKLLAEREKDIKSTHGWGGFPPGTTALAIAKRWGHTAIASILSG